MANPFDIHSHERKKDSYKVIFEKFKRDAVDILSPCLLMDYSMDIFEAQAIGPRSTSPWTGAKQPPSWKATQWSWEPFWEPPTQ
eukprot:jgi/Psemu1/56632/gm1.56632_g